MEIKIGIVDDHILIRDSIASVVNTYEGCKVVLLAENGQDLIEKLKPVDLPDLLILDINMPEKDGFETSWWLYQHYPTIRILILTMFDSELIMLRLIRSGVKGMVKKNIHPGILEKAIRIIMANGYFFSNISSRNVSQLMHSMEEPKTSGAGLQLSDNELEFLKLACSDLTYKEIAKEMNVSPRTVDNYRDSLFDKLNVKSRVGLALYAMKSGVISL